MAQTANNIGINGRTAAMARRRAMAQDGKTATKLSPEALVAREHSTTTVISDTPAVSSSKKSSVKTAAPVQQSVARIASRKRRQAMSTSGKAAIGGASSSGTPLRGTAARRTAAKQAAQQQTNQAATQSTDSNCNCGCKSDANNRETVSTNSRSAEMRANAKIRAVAKKTANQSVGRAASVARRRSMSNRGKAGVGSQGLTPAQTARATNPQLSGRELAQTLREQRSKRGKAGQKSNESSRRSRRRPQVKAAGPAEDAPWKVGASETSHGQTVTGTMTGRSPKVSGDEQSTCRSITGTEYMGADIFRDFCQAEPAPAKLRIGTSETIRGQQVTGNEVGRSERVTGDEAGSCKHVTGDEYVGAEQSEKFCGIRPEPKPQRITSAETSKGKTVTGDNVGRSTQVTGDEPGSGRQLTGSQYMTPVADASNDQVPAKVGASATLRGGGVTGTMVGRSQRVTGDETGSCRNVTGDDYVGQEQYEQFCEAVPQPQDQKVGLTGTLRGQTVTGTMTGRSERVTGDEPGTCKAVTGTPYAGLEQLQAYCGTEKTAMATSRMRPIRQAVSSVMTGKQPGIGDTNMTGNQKGQCEPLTGTPYVGADQHAAACSADINSPDFPQPLDGESWGDFSVAAPSHAATANATDAGVTGTRYEQGQITGPFGKAGGTVTGTEDFRFGQGVMRQPTTPQANVATNTAETESEPSFRVTGEGMAAGNKITGNDWERGDRVTGTEGSSATRRNPTRRGEIMDSMAFQQAFKSHNAEAVEVPVSKVTGGSGNTAKGALVTYSGGARG